MEEAILRNIDACIEISKMTRTSLGPMGMNKIVVNHIDKVYVTNDAHTIIDELEVQHPAAKIIVLAAKMQETEIGDGTNFVLVFAGELMTAAQSLLKMGLHPSEILLGYEKAYEKTLQLISEMDGLEVTDIRSKESLLPPLKSVLGTKMYGYEDALAPLIFEAISFAMPENINNFDVDNVRVAKILGGSIYQSKVIRGMVALRAPETQIYKVQKSKVAIYNCPIEAQSGDTKGTVLLKSAEELMNYTRSEEDMMEKFIKDVAEAGIKVVVAGSNLSDIAVHFFQKYEIMVVKILSKFELRRYAKSLGAALLVRLGAPTPEETGFVDEVYVSEIGGEKATIFVRNEDCSRIGTIIVRASTKHLMDDCERAVNDGVNLIRCLVKNPKLIPGAGASEIFLANQIQQYAKTEPGLDQYAIEKFGEALEVIPRTIAENAGMKSEEIIAKLNAEILENKKVGVNVEEGNVSETQIWDSIEMKNWGFNLAVDAVLTVLKVDQIIMSKPAGGPDQNKAVKMQQQMQ